MRFVISVLLVCIVVLSGCTKQNDNIRIDNVRENVDSKDIYMSYNLEIPYDKNTTELDYIAEQCIGLLTNKDGQIEMFTVTRSVKERFREEAENLIKQKEQLRPEMLECRIWRFTLDEERNWDRKAVCKSSFVNEEEILKLNTKLVKFSPSYDLEGNLTVFMQYSIETENDNSAYGIRAFKLENKGWKTLGEYIYEENEEDIQEPIKTYMDVNDNLIVARMDGSIIKYNFTLKELIDESDDLGGDLSLSTFSNEYGFCKDNSKNEIVLFDTGEFVEEKRLSIPETNKSGPEVMGVNSKDTLYYANALGIYTENNEETGLKKIFSMDTVSGVAVENMMFNFIGVSSEGDMILHMYDPIDEAAQEYIHMIKKVEK